jgi:hypothetical protein
MTMPRLLLLTGMLSAPVFAQDISPSFDSSTFAQGQATIQGSTAHARGGWNRGARSGATARQRAACAGLPRYRSQYGGDHPSVVQLGRMCRQAGLSQ